MSLNAAAIEYLIGKGMGCDDLLALARALEADKPRSAAAKRQARYRQKKLESVTDDATSDVTVPLKDNSKPQGSEPIGSGASADPLKDSFDLGIVLLTSTGLTEKNARSLVGKWIKARSAGEVLTALVDCRARAIVNPVEWLEKRFAGGRYVSASGYEYRGSLEQIKREAARRNDTDTLWKVQADLKAAQAPASIDDQIASLERMLSVYETAGRTDLVDQCNSRIDELRKVAA